MNFTGIANNAAQFVRRSVSNVEKFTVQNSSVILTSLGVAGVLSTGVMAARAGIVSEKVITSVEETNADREDYQPLSFKDKAKLTYKYYIPPVVIGGLSMASIIGAHRVDTQKQAMLASACAIAESRLEEYQREVIATIGDEAEKTIRNKFYEKRQPKYSNRTGAPIDQNDDSAKKAAIVPIQTIHGQVLCEDVYNGRRFYSDPIWIEKQVNEINRLFIQNDEIYGNEICDILDLPHTKFGWDMKIERTEPQDTIDIIFDSYFDSTIMQDVVTIEFSPKPKVCEHYYGY